MALHGRASREGGLDRFSWGQCLHPRPLTPVHFLGVIAIWMFSSLLGFLSTCASIHRCGRRASRTLTAEAANSSQEQVPDDKPVSDELPDKKLLLLLVKKMSALERRHEETHLMTKHWLEKTEQGIEQGTEQGGILETIASPWKGLAQQLSFKPAQPTEAGGLRI